MSSPSFLANHFLIAMPNMGASYFAETVTLICQHDENGALGVIVNQPTPLTLADIFSQLQLENLNPTLSAQPVMSGGPIQPERGLVIHRPNPEWTFESTLQISTEIALTTSRDVIEGLAKNHGPREILLAVGYAGWSSGQLEAELADNAWLTAPANSAILFATPVEQRRRLAAQQLGIDLTTLSSGVGHA